jgi:hypothetical protein
VTELNALGVFQVVCTSFLLGKILRKSTPSS